MRSLRVRLVMVVVAVLAAALASAAVVVASKRSTVSPGRTASINCRSPSLGGTLPALVYLPPGYSKHSKPYPVVYFLHGLPAGPSSYQSNGFVAAALQAAGDRGIVVAPQGARSSDSDREYLDWSPTENWPQAISHDLTACIAHRYHTISGRLGRALIGLSAGGYGAFNIGARNLQTFGAVESWSGYFAATDPAGDHVLDLGSTQANDDAAVPSGPALAETVTKYPSLLAFYVGLQDSRFLIMNRQYDAALTASQVPHTFRTYPGGHSGALWRAQAPSWLKMALDYLSAARRSHRPGSSALARLKR
jgi:enterochelin esterase-like enzyme